MIISKYIRLFIIFPLSILCIGMSCAPRKSINIETQRLVLQSIVEEALGDIEFTYASKNLEDCLKLLDKDFEGKSRFQSSLSNYFLSMDKAQLHLVIDMIIADRNGISVRLHWFKKVVTNSSITIKQQGVAQFLFKRYPEGLKLKSVVKDNPFF